MNSSESLGGLGMQLPSASYLLAMIFFSIVGFAFYRYGKKIQAPITMWTGIALMLYGYVVSDELWVWVTGVGLCCGLYVFRGR